MDKDKELFDIVDKQGNVIGEATRGEAHSDPSLIHPVIHCWIFNAKGQVLLQKRAPEKKLYPNSWDISVGGHLSKGDSPEDGLLREMEEEIGIVPTEYELIQKYVVPHDSQTELVYLYMVRMELDPKELTLQQEEVAEVKWFDLDTLFTLAVNDDLDMTPWIYIQLPIVLQGLIATE